MSDILHRTLFVLFLDKQVTIFAFLNKKSSSKRRVRYGVPRRALLGPHLLCIFITDLTLQISNYKINNDLSTAVWSLHTREKYILLETSIEGRRNGVANFETNSMIIYTQKKTRNGDWYTSEASAYSASEKHVMVTGTRQKHQLIPLQLRIILEKIDSEQQYEHRDPGV